MITWLFFTPLSGVISPYWTQRWLWGPPTVARIYRVRWDPNSRLPNSWQLSLHVALFHIQSYHHTLPPEVCFLFFQVLVCCWGAPRWRHTETSGTWRFLFGWTSGGCWPKDCYPKAKTFDPKRFINGIQVGSSWWDSRRGDSPLQNQLGTGPMGGVNEPEFSAAELWQFGSSKLPGYWVSMILRVLDFIPFPFCLSTTSLKTLGWWNYMCFYFRVRRFSQMYSYRRWAPTSYTWSYNPHK